MIKFIVKCRNCEHVVKGNTLKGKQCYYCTLHDKRVDRDYYCKEKNK